MASLFGVFCLESLGNLEYLGSLENLESLGNLEYLGNLENLESLGNLEYLET